MRTNFTLSNLLFSFPFYLYDSDTRKLRYKNTSRLSLSILKKFAELKKEPWWSSFGKAVGLQHPNLLKRNPKMSVLLGVTDIIFWGISGNSYYMESLQIIDKFCSSHLLIFLNMAYLQSQRSYKKPKDIQSSLHFLSPRSFHKVLIFCILLSNFLTGSCCFSIHILKVKFWLL